MNIMFHFMYSTIHRAAWMSNFKVSGHKHLCPQLQYNHVATVNGYSRPKNKYN